MGQAILEEVPVQDRHRAWIDLVSQMFGGLALCSLEALVTRDGTEVIIEVNDSAMGLLGESQEEDRRRIAEVVLAAMETACISTRAVGKFIYRASLRQLGTIQAVGPGNKP